MKTDTPLPYHQIPEAPDSYTNVHVTARLIDGLGYRYYWATEGLTATDLAYEPGGEGRPASTILEHLFNLSQTILNGVKNTPNIRPLPEDNRPFDQKRKATLENLKAASDLLRAAKETDMDELKVIFQRGEKTASFPFWNMINGPITDAIYHVGQIVSYRRSSGNPINPMVNVFIGKTRE